MRRGDQRSTSGSHSTVLRSGCGAVRSRAHGSAPDRGARVAARAAASIERERGALCLQSAAAVPNQILLQPAPIEYGVHRDQYDALIADLESEGVLVRVVAPVEERNGGLPGGVQQSEFYDLVIHVGEAVGALVRIGMLITMVQRRLHARREKRLEPRRAKLYLANGEEQVIDLGDDE